MGGILSYHQKMAGFESSWLILLKALVINEISAGEFISLVVKKQSPPITASRFRWDESHQFNPTALRSTLRLSSQVFDNAFLDRLLTSSYTAPIALVRHCPECIKNLYHCTLFQIPWITECPVHHVQLLSCKACSSIFKDPKLKALRAKDRSRLCPHVWPFMQSPFPVHLLSDDVCALFSAWGESLVTWFRKSQAIGAEDLLEIISVPLSSHSVKNRFAYWRYLEGQIGTAPLSIPAAGYVTARLTLERLYGSDVWASDTDYLHLVACFKSLRRHIYKKFVKPHRRCINQFRRLKLSEYYALDGNARCSCALAYYSWLVSVFNLYTMQDLNDRYINPYIPSGKFHRYATHSSVGRFLLEAWTAFHDQWGVYELYDWGNDAQCDLEVHIGSERGLALRPLNLSLRTYSASGAPKNCYFPQGSFLLHQSRTRCKERCGGSLLLKNLNVSDSTGNANIPRQILFELRHHPYLGSKKRRIFRI